MTNTEKRNLLQQKPPRLCCLVDYYIQLFNSIGANKYNYWAYMTTEPIDCNKELERLPDADYDLCCALMTMLFREDHFCEGTFDRRYKNGDAQRIIDRMIELLVSYI